MPSVDDAVALTWLLESLSDDSLARWPRRKPISMTAIITTSRRAMIRPALTSYISSFIGRMSAMLVASCRPRGLSNAGLAARMGTLRRQQPEPTE